MRTYIPLWTDKYSEPEQQYKLGWIYASTKEQPIFSLLPLRYYGRGHIFADDFYQSYTVNHYYPQMTGWHWLVTRIKPAIYYFAEELYKKAAQCVLEKYPDLSNVTFLSQTKDGIYPCVWNVPYNILLSEIEYNIKKIYDDGFYIDEYLEQSESVDELRNATTVEIQGILDDNHYEITEYFYKCHPKDYLKRELKKNIRFSIEECYKLYRIFTEEELCFGNQSRIYSENEKHYSAEFKAADNHDFDSIMAFAKSGFDLNTMGRWGETAFSRFIHEGCSLEKLDKLISLGANPALYGCEYDVAESPLWNACFNCDAPLVEYLLSKGVNPKINTSTDDPYGEFLIDRIERWAYEAETKETKKQEESILEILKTYI